MNIKISSNRPGMAKVEIDGEEIKGVTALRLDGAHDKPFVVTLQMIPKNLDIVVDGQVQVLQQKMRIEMGGKGRKG